jgi:hypothetical protein
MAERGGPKQAGVRGKQEAQSSLGLAALVSETARLWRKHHLSYDQIELPPNQIRGGASAPASVRAGSLTAIIYELRSKLTQLLTLLESR